MVMLFSSEIFLIASTVSSGRFTVSFTAIFECLLASDTAICRTNPAHNTSDLLLELVYSSTSDAILNSPPCLRADRDLVLGPRGLRRLGRGPRRGLLAPSLC